MQDKNQAAVCGTKVTSTIKRSDKDNFISCTIDRDNLWEIQTPQVFKKYYLLKHIKQLI